MIHRCNICKNRISNCVRYEVDRTSEKALREPFCKEAALQNDWRVYLDPRSLNGLLKMEPPEALVVVRRSINDSFGICYSRE
jgi:hypothetical protein